MNRQPLVVSLAAFALVFLCAPSMLEAKRLISDYTMRVHIYETHWNHSRTGYHAFGRANLFDDQGTPHGVEFTYDCDDHLMASNANEAYPAKWKKPGRELEVVFGEIGAKADQFHDCSFMVSEKSFVFFRNRGEVGTESAQEFMASHKAQMPTIGPATSGDIPSSANTRSLF